MTLIELTGDLRRILKQFEDQYLTTVEVSDDQTTGLSVTGAEREQQDYEVVSTDERHRNNHLQAAYALSVLFIGLSIAMGYWVFLTDEIRLAVLVSLYTVLVLFILYIWIQNTQGAREASAARRAALEAHYEGYAGGEVVTERNRTGFAELDPDKWIQGMVAVSLIGWTIVFIGFILIWLLSWIIRLIYLILPL